MSSSSRCPHHPVVLIIPVSSSSRCSSTRQPRSYVVQHVELGRCRHTGGAVDDLGDVERREIAPFGYPECHFQHARFYALRHCARNRLSLSIGCGGRPQRVREQRSPGPPGELDHLGVGCRSHVVRIQIITGWRSRFFYFSRCVVHSGFIQGVALADPLRVKIAMTINTRRS